MGYGKRKCRDKRFLGIVLALCLIFGTTLPAFADMGEKPSVTLKVLNPPSKEYRVGLLVRGEPHDPEELEDEFEYVNGDPGYRDMFKYEGDGYCFAHHPGPGFFIMSSNDILNGTYRFTYYAPSTFKVIVVSGDSCYISEHEIVSSRYACYAIFDCETNELYEDLEAYEEYDRTFFKRSIRFLILTLLIEGFLLFAFGLGQVRNIVVFLVTNVLTQVFLHYRNWSYRRNDGSGLGASISFIGTELLIVIIETIVFAILMKEKDEKRWKVVVYAIVANLVSAFFNLPALR